MVKIVVCSVRPWYMVGVKVKGQVANVYGNLCTYILKVYGGVCLRVRILLYVMYISRGGWHNFRDIIFEMALVPRFFQKLGRPLSRTVGQARVFAASYHEKVRSAVPVSTSAQAGKG